MARNPSPARHTDVVRSPTVFGNGRTHSGGLEGSGGSRLANNCQRALTCPPPRQDSSQGEEGLFFIVGEHGCGCWVCVSGCRRSSEGSESIVPP